MVYSLAYQPKPNSWPDVRQIGGDTDLLPLEDPTPDGGVSLIVGRYFSGRRLVANDAPKQVLWASKRKLLDYESSRMINVSARFRDLIEEIEPGIHQFIPVEFVAKDGSLLGTRWFWQVCNRLDSVHRGLTNWTMFESGSAWREPNVPGAEFIFNLDAIGQCKFWHDKHISSGRYVTDEVKARIDRAGMTGLRYYRYEQA